MSIAMRSFAKINLGLKIGPARPDGFHELRTVYQTLALHDVVRVEVQPGSGIEIRCNDPRVPLDATNTCYRIGGTGVGDVGVALGRLYRGRPQVPRLAALARDDKNNKRRLVTGQRPPATRNRDAAFRRKVVIDIDKRLPVQGGMGAASSNAVAAMLGLERALGVKPPPQKTSCASRRRWAATCRCS